MAAFSSRLVPSAILRPRSITARSPAEANAALAALLAGGIELADFSMGSPSLDEVFFALTGRDAGTDRAGTDTGDRA